MNYGIVIFGLITDIKEYKNASDVEEALNLTFQYIDSYSQDLNTQVKLYTILYNIFREKEKYRYTVLMKLFDFWDQQNWAAVIKKNVDIIDQISANWPIKNEERIQMYKKGVELMASINEYISAYKLMLKAVEIIGNSKQLIKDNQDFVKQTVVQAFHRPEIAQFDVLFNLPAVQALIPDEEIEGYEQWVTISKSFMDSTGAESERYNKLIYLIFCAHSFIDKKISYDEIAKLVNISKDDVEDFITDAIIGNILDARIDQENECLIVNSVFSHKKEKEIHNSNIWPYVIKYMSKIYSSN